MSLSPRQADWKLTAVLLIIGILGLAPLTIGFFVKQPGSLTVILHDPVFQTDLASRRCRIFLDGRPAPGSVESGSQGNTFSVGTVEARPYDVRWEVDGFRPGNGSVVVNPRRVQPVTTLNAKLDPTFGRLEVEGKDALTDRRLADYAGVSLDGGETRPLTNGSIMFADLEPGVHRLRMDAEGYCPEERAVNVVQARTTRETVALSPSIRQNEAARIILDWKNPPDDIDAHLLIRLDGEKDPRHVFFRALESVKEGRHVATLDVDKRKPGGFETVTINKGFTGRYLYLVNNYSRLEAVHKKLPLPHPQHMTNADLAVRLYVSGDCRPRVYRLPDNHEDLNWPVFELVVDQQGFISVQNSPQTKPGQTIGKTTPDK